MPLAVPPSDSIQGGYWRELGWLDLLRNIKVKITDGGGGCSATAKNCFLVPALPPCACTTFVIRYYEPHCLAQSHKLPAQLACNLILLKLG